MLYDFTGREGMIVAPSGLNSASTHPVGAGPFQFSSFAPGSKLSIRTYPGYFQKDRYKIGGFDFIQVSTGPPAVTALRSGAVDLIRFEAESYAGLKADSKVGVAVQNTGAYLQLQFRFTPPFDNIKVRQAVLHAINKDEINKTVQDGLGEVATQPYAKSSPVYVPEIANLYPFDQAKARQLLAEAGHPNGLSFDMVIPGGNITNMERQGSILQQQLAAVGIKANIVRILGSDIATGYYISGRGNAFAAEKLAEAFPPNLINGSYGKGQFVSIWSHFNPDTNPPMPALLDQITATMNQALAASDPKQAYDLTKQASKVVMENALEVPIAFAPQMMAFDKAKVGGTVHAQTNICDPPDLTGTTVKG
jgi:ABC-type transport system substrate-binding protein